MKYVASFSGGKDSTAMVLRAIEEGLPLDEIVMFDTGWEFPQMYDHIEKFEAFTGRKVTILKPQQSFEHWMFDRKVIAKKGDMKGQCRFVGLGWPWAGLRWCTGKKLDAISKYRNSIGDHFIYIGIAADEADRAVATTETKRIRYGRALWPLLDWDMDEASCLAYCRSRGFDWGGLYDHFRRVSCWCCPLKGLSELRALRKHHPDLWERLNEMDLRSRNSFRGDATVADLEHRFAKEDQQGVLAL